MNFNCSNKLYCNLKQGKFRPICFFEQITIFFFIFMTFHAFIIHIKKCIISHIDYRGFASIFCESVCVVVGVEPEKHTPKWSTNSVNTDSPLPPPPPSPAESRASISKSLQLLLWWQYCKLQTLTTKVTAGHNERASS